VEEWLKHAPIRRLGKPEDQANAIVFFAGDESDWITGQCMEVCGGYGLGAPVFGDIAERMKQ
jgi:NAD(P)-dependent dehydrogenase (short-subunit alcohol dehydrogenase family)